jgi:signal transduction histidine kinase
MYRGALVVATSVNNIVFSFSQLLKVFQNLVGNALKFCGLQKPTVHISCRQVECQWLFLVRDNGIGIDPNAQDRIFDIFARAHTMEAYPGTGIGLSLCKRIVERHGGRIWVTSQPNHGATFYFTMPM